MQFAFWEASGTDTETEDAGEEWDRLGIGTGAEHLVAADLWLSGHRCFFASAGMSFDVAVELEDGSISRIQVKATARPRTDGDRRGYIFEPRGSRRSDGSRTTGLKAYLGKADIFAFVAIDLRRVMYAKVADAPNRVVIKSDAFSEDACRLSMNLALRQE